MSKIGRNDKCPCKSGKKYKQCCFINLINAKREESDRFDEGHRNSTEHVELVMEFLKDEYKNHKVIDITNYLNNQTYKPYQIRHYTNRVIMVAEKCDSNKEVFLERGQPDNDMMVMYRGSYRTFRKNELAQVYESIDKMIQTRLAGKEDK
jgi:hypothetical protein